MTDRLTVEEARVALVNGRDEDLQVNMDALLAARDAEWRAAVEKVWVRISGDHIGGEYPEGCAALDALLREVPHDGQ